MWPSLMDLVALIKMCVVHEKLITTHSREGHVRKKEKEKLPTNCVFSCSLVVFIGLLTAAALILSLSAAAQ